MNILLRKDRWNDLFEWSLYATAAVSLVYNLIVGNSAGSFQSVLILAVLTLIRLLVKVTKSELFPALRFSVLFFIFLAMVLANLFGFYHRIAFLDKIEHLLSGVILYFVGRLIWNRHHSPDSANDAPATICTYFCLFFSIAMAGIWEVYEFTTDYLFGLHSQNGSLTDTMGDIICGTSGATATALYGSFQSSRRTGSGERRRQKRRIVKS